MPVWRIVPAPRDTGSGWLGYERWMEVVVRADSAARARVVAADQLGDRSDPVGNESAAGYAALEDEKRYHVLRMEDGAVDTERAGGAEGVLSAVQAERGR